MAKIDQNAGTPDTAVGLATGQFTGLRQSGSVVLRGPFNFNLWGTFVATVSLERSFDGGATWLNVSLSSGAPNAFTQPISWAVPGDQSGERNVLYRLNCTAYTSGTVNYRISQ